MATRSTLARVVVALVLSVVLASPALALQREELRREGPIVRVIKKLLHTIGMIPNDEIAVPKP